MKIRRIPDHPESELLSAIFVSEIFAANVTMHSVSDSMPPPQAYTIAATIKAGANCRGRERGGF